MWLLTGDVAETTTRLRLVRLRDGMLPRRSPATINA